MAHIDLLTYCGLHCDLCAQRGRIPQQAATLRQSMADEGFEYFGPSLEGFRPFWRFLDRLCDPDQCCSGCRQGGGDPMCEIRLCAQERELLACPFCHHYPCSRVEKLAQAYPNLVSDGLRMREICMEAWLVEQQARVADGFVYADIRLPGAAI